MHADSSPSYHCTTTTRPTRRGSRNLTCESWSTIIDWRVQPPAPPLAWNLTAAVCSNPRRRLLGDIPRIYCLIPTIVNFLPDWMTACISLALVDASMKCSARWVEVRRLQAWCATPPSIHSSVNRLLLKWDSETGKLPFKDKIRSKQGSIFSKKDIPDMASFTQMQQYFQSKLFGSLVVLAIVTSVLTFSVSWGHRSLE
jgi:hypothetical protein